MRGNSRPCHKARSGWALLVILWLAAVLPAAARQAAEQASLPDTPAGRKMSALLAALNSGNPAAMVDFISANYARESLAERPAESRAEAYLEIYEESGGFDLRHVFESTDQTLAVVGQDRLVGDWMQFEIELERDPPHGILGLRVMPMPGPPDAPPLAPLTDEALAREIVDYVKRMEAADRFSGALLVAREGKPIVQYVCGLASRAFQAPNRLDTKFNLGSMNKMFTAVAVAQLAQQGKLSFDDPVGKHLPDFPNAEVREKVTIHHLLTHTSGLGDYFNEKYEAGAKNRFRTVRDFLELFQDETLQFEPGSEWRYSNGGFMLLGAIIEKVSGQSYFDYVREHIYQRAGMNNTDAYEMDRDTPNLAIGYTQRGPGWPLPPGERRNNLYLHVVKGGPAGGGFSTVEDLVRFAAALRAHTLLSAEYTEIVTSGKVFPDPEDRDFQYAYGFGVERAGQGWILGHNGGFLGINAKLDIYQDGSGIVVAVLSNYDPPAAGRVAAKIRSLLTRE